MRQNGAQVFDVPADESIVVNTIDAVSRFRGVEAEELEPLYGSIDPDALEQFLENSDAAVNVTFRYEGLDVTVRTDGRISISESVGSP